MIDYSALLLFGCINSHMVTFMNQSSAIFVYKIVVFWKTLIKHIILFNDNKAQFFRQLRQNQEQSLQKVARPRHLSRQISIHQIR